MNASTNHDMSHTSWLRRMFSRTDHAAAATPVSPAPEPARPKKPARNQKVLVVDDDPLFLKISATQLEADGYDVLTAKDGCEAIELARKQKPDVVVLDVNLPNDVSGVPWDGFRIVTWLRRFEPLKQIPVIMMTSTNPAQYTRDAIRAGASAFFHKRLDQAHLLTLVSQTLSRRGLTHALAGGKQNFDI